MTSANQPIARSLIGSLWAGLGVVQAGARHELAAKLEARIRRTPAWASS